jgi:hypothetical protein
MRAGRAQSLEQRVPRRRAVLSPPSWGGSSGRAARSAPPESEGDSPQLTCTRSRHQKAPPRKLGPPAQVQASTEAERTEVREHPLTRTPAASLRGARLAWGPAAKTSRRGEIAGRPDSWQGVNACVFSAASSVFSEPFGTCTSDRAPSAARSHVRPLQEALS